MSWILPKKDQISAKLRKRYVDSPNGKSIICLIHGPGNSSEECKVLGDFGTKCAKSRSTKYHGNNYVPRGGINIHKENKTIVNNAANEILLTQKVRATNHKAPEFMYSNYDANALYKVDINES